MVLWMLINNQYLREEALSLYIHIQKLDPLKVCKYVVKLIVHGVMFKCAGPKAATWGRDGGSEHVGGRGDPPENTYQFLLIGSLGFIFFARCMQHIAQYLREETYFHYPHSDVLIR